MIDNVIPFPTKNQVDQEGLMLELEIAERRVEAIKRQLGILALELGVEE